MSAIAVITAVIAWLSLTVLVSALSRPLGWLVASGYRRVVAEPARWSLSTALSTSNEGVDVVTVDASDPSSASTHHA